MKPLVSHESTELTSQLNVQYKRNNLLEDSVVMSSLFAIMPCFWRLPDMFRCVSKVLDQNTFARL